MLTLLDLPAAERELAPIERPRRAAPPPLPPDVGLPLLAVDDLEPTQRIPVAQLIGLCAACAAALLFFLVSYAA